MARAILPEMGNPGLSMGGRLMRVLLIDTPYPFEEYPRPSLSLGYLGAVLEREDVDVQILDFLVAEYSSEKLRKKLEEYQPQVVGVTSSTLNYLTARQILRVCKGCDPDIVTVIGGPHVSFTAEDTLEQAPWIDIVVRGEGEETIIELIRALETGGELGGVMGIAFRQDRRVVLTQPRPFIKDLDSLPFPAWHLVPLSKYLAIKAEVSVSTSRGCPYGCIFCCGPLMMGHRVRLRSPKLVVDEIEKDHKEVGIKEFHLIDDTFTLNHRHAQQICDEIRARNLDIELGSFSRADHLTKELLVSMREAGFTGVLFGVESGSQKILNTIKKNITLDEIREGTKLATENGIGVFANFILGLPGETPETARESMDFGRELREKYGAIYGFHLLSPFPGSELYEKADEYSIKILSGDWADYDANRPITETADMKAWQAQEISDYYDRAAAYAWAEKRLLAESGDLQCRKELEEKDSRQFAWRLLKGDVIERVGRIKITGAQNPAQGEQVEELAQRVSQRLAAPLDSARHEIWKLAQKGLLRCEREGKGFVWKWG